MKASDLFLRCLEAEGVDTIYGVPGEENADIMISLLNSPIEFITCRHEQAAAFMADMHGRLTGRPGVCLATLGPGATNLVTGVASANMDHAPLVAIIGQAGTNRLHKESHQQMDSVAMFHPITKWATTVRDANNIPEIVRKAFKLSMAEKPGATVIELPEDIAKDESEELPIQPRENCCGEGVEMHLVRSALEVIAEAQHPVVLVGNSAARERASAQIIEFVDKTGIHAATTFMGKGMIPARHPKCLYSVGLSRRDIVLEAFEQADLVICIGYDMMEWHPEQWNTGVPKKIIHIDTRPAEVDKHYSATLDIAGSIPETIAAINAGLGPAHKKESPHFDKLRERMTESLHEFDADTAFPMKPQRILSALREAMRDDDILISDVGAHKMWIARHYPAQAPASCFITNSFCSMGFALPSAIEAKRLNPEKNVVALCGDGGFMMNVQDLITAVRYKAPITILIWDDNDYGLIRWKQEVTYCRSSNTELTNPDFVLLAQAFGCQGIRVNSADEFRPALDKAFAETTRPTVIALPVDYGENIKLSLKMGKIVCRS